MHPFDPVPQAPRRRHDLREQRARGRRWPRTVTLALLGTLALVAIPVALAPAPVPPSDASAEQVLRDLDPATRSGSRAEPSMSPTSTPSTPAPTTPAPTTTAPSASAPAAPPAAAPAAPPAAAPAPEQEPAPAPAPAAPTMVEEIVTRTNAERAAAGLPALTVSECATAQAVERTALLVAEDRFEHDPLEPVLEACDARGVGENLALGYPTAMAVVAGWMGSEGHRANILREGYTQIGVGCTDGPRGLLCAQVFLS